MKKHLTIKGKPVYDMEALFARLLVVGEHLGIDLKDLFEHELSPLPASLLDDFGCLRKGDKSVIVKKLGVVSEAEEKADIIFVDGSQLLYHVTWPSQGRVCDLAASMSSRLHTSYIQQIARDIFVIFDNYGTELVAKDHKRKRRGEAGTVKYHLTTNTPLPARDTITKSNENKKQLFNLLPNFDSPADRIVFIKPSQSLAQHEEADVTLVSYMLSAAESGAPVIRILSDDTDVFVLLVYWVWRVAVKDKVQMAKLDRTLIDINLTVEKTWRQKWNTPWIARHVRL